MRSKNKQGMVKKPQAKSGTEKVFWAPITSHTNSLLLDFSC